MSACCCMPLSGRFSRRAMYAVPAVVLLAASVLARPTLAQGGLLGGLKKRAGEAVERAASERLNREIDAAAQKMVDRSFDTMFGAVGGGAGGTGGGTGGGTEGGKAPRFALLPNAPTEAAYEFDATLTYEIESQPAGKPAGEKALLTMLVRRDGRYMGTRIAPEQRKRDDPELTAIFDVGNESMVMLMQTEKEKTSIAYSWKEAKQYAATTPAATPDAGGSVPSTILTPDGKPMTFKALGRRTIAGREAEGYQAADENGEVEVWVTQDAGLPSSRFMGPAASMRQMKGVLPSAYPAGLLVEVVSTERKSGNRGRMVLRSIDKAARVRVDMQEYPRLGKGK